MYLAKSDDPIGWGNWNASGSGDTEHKERFPESDKLKAKNKNKKEQNIHLMDPLNSFIKHISNLLTYGIFFALQSFPLDNLLFLGLWYLKMIVYQKANMLHWWKLTSFLQYMHAVVR